METTPGKCHVSHITPPLWIAISADWMDEEVSYVAAWAYVSHTW